MNTEKIEQLKALIAQNGGDRPNDIAKLATIVLDLVTAPAKEDDGQPS